MTATVKLTQPYSVMVSGTFSARRQDTPAINSDWHQTSLYRRITTETVKRIWRYSVMEHGTCCHQEQAKRQADTARLISETRQTCRQQPFVNKPRKGIEKPTS